jgi:hypothetical protein
MDSSAAPRSIDAKVIDVGKSDRRNRDRVVLFLPGPVTESDLLREKLYHSAAARRRQQRRVRTRWIAENAGTIVFVSVLLVLAWWVSARY